MPEGGIQTFSGRLWETQKSLIRKINIKFASQRDGLKEGEKGGEMFLVYFSLLKKSFVLVMTK